MIQVNYSSNAQLIGFEDLDVFRGPARSPQFEVFLVQSKQLLAIQAPRGLPESLDTARYATNRGANRHSVARFPPILLILHSRAATLWRFLFFLERTCNRKSLIALLNSVRS